MNKKVLYTLFGLTLVVAAFFRFYYIGSLPGGLFPDEAANGLDINLMEQGHTQPFYERGNGREALFFYMLWGAVKVFGRSPFAHHFTSALVGLAATVLCFLVAKVLFENYRGKPIEAPATRAVSVGRKTLLQIIPTIQQPGFIIALLAMTVMATSTWHIVLSRTAFRANLIPLFCGLTFLALLKIPIASTRAKQFLWSIIFGAALALGFYTYIAYRIIIPLIVIVVLWPFLAAIKTQGIKVVMRTYTPLLAAAVLTFAIVIAPLAHYFYTHPGSFIGRSGQVSIFNPELNGGDLVGTALEVTRLSLMGYFTDGDLNWRHNVSGMAFLSPIVSPFFALGLLVVLWGAVRYFFSPLRQQKRFPHFFLAGWFFSFLIPVITTAEGIPHGLRAIGTIPAVFIITAYGLYLVGHYVWRMVLMYPHGNARMETALQLSLRVLVVCFAVSLPLQAYSAYFIGAANSPENYFAFRSDLTEVSDYLRQYGNRDTTYLVLDKFSVQTVDYLTTIEGKTSCDRTLHYRPSGCTDNATNKPYMQVDPEDSWLASDDVKNGQKVWEKGLASGMTVVFTQSSIFDIKKFKIQHPSSTLEREVRNKFGQAILAVYRIE